jgi:predicted TIM-barrel fold metal-dependent hydrolase
MAGIPFVDTHIHLYDLKLPQLRHDWLEPESIHPFLGNIDALKAPRYWLDDYVAETRFSGIAKAVHVQCAGATPDPVEETRWLQAEAERVGFPLAIVAECHLASPRAESILDRHMESPGLRGIRDYNVGDVDYLGDPAWQRGCATLAKRGLVACIDTRWQRFEQLLALAARLPDVTFCIDHCAIPEARTPDYFRAWSEGMQRFAPAGNVVVKISGLGMHDRRWTIDSLRPWVLAAIDAVGPTRIIFGTNWPVDRMFSSLPDLLAAYDTIIAGFSEHERRAMFAGNAERIFRF